MVVHSGSRYLGKQVAELYQNEAVKRLNNDSQFAKQQKLIAQLKKEGRQSEIQQVLKMQQGQNEVVPKALAYVEGALFDSYIHDMKIVQKYAVYNRKSPQTYDGTCQRTVRNHDAGKRRQQGILG